MIKPNEITIGVLLRTNKGEVIKVESISTKRQHRKLGYHREGDPCHIHYVRLAQCEGIELTEEILLANGFEFEYQDRRGYRIYTVGAYDVIHICIDTQEHCFFVIIGAFMVKFRYVHQLQFILSIGGFYELTTNFIIK